MFGIYKGKCYDYVYFRKHYELITEHAEKAFDEFTQRSDLCIKVTDENDPDLTDIYDVELWVKYDCGFPNVSNEWVIYLDGHCKTLEDGFMVETSKNVPGWKQCDKDAVCGKIPFSDIEGAWVEYKYIKKDDIVLDEPLAVRENVSVEKLIEIRKFYGCEGKL